MYRRVLAFDFDGTLAVNGDVPPEVETALEQCRASGHVLFLVTGRRYETVSLGRLAELFSGIVWENGAVLSHTASGETYLPFGQLDPRLLKAIEEAGIPFERGLAIAATWTPHDQALWHILSSQGSSTSLEYNKSAVMVLPPGATKGSGLERLLALCGLSPRNLAAFGDAENDLSMMTLAEVAVAVADAVPAVIETADVIATAPGPEGVLEILKQYPLGGKFLDIPLKRERPILLGQTESGTAIHVPAARLAGLNLGVFGNSATGKSWMVGLLAEGLHHEDYQVLLIDPEGDFRGLRVLPRFASISGDRATLPSPSAVVSLIEEGGVSLVLDLSQYPVTLRSHYVAELMRALRPVRERKFRPHWIVLDEAQEFLFEGSEVTSLLRPVLEVGGWAFVSYRPDRLSGSVLESLNHLLLTRITDNMIGDCLRTHCSTCNLKGASLNQIPMGSALLCGGEVVRMRPAIRRVPHVRHLYKYLDVPLPPGKRFVFRTEKGHLGLEAASLYELSHVIPTLPLESLEYHDRREDFVKWAESTLGDAGLASRLRKVANRRYQGEELREALNQVVSTHYEEIRRSR
ncbi:MAG: HAD hydrolase family protein [Nitrospira sp.]|nr:HAD hydrolase family protein [Nitrospira sp.]MDH5337051.1 HAD hydrolase family protein [Nitrospira sp.]